MLGLLATGCPSHQTPFGDDAPPDDAGGGAPDADPAAPGRAAAVGRAGS